MIFQDPMTSLDPTFPVGEQSGGDDHGAPADVDDAQARERALELLGTSASPSRSGASATRRTASPAGCASAS